MMGIKDHKHADFEAICTTKQKHGNNFVKSAKLKELWSLQRLRKPTSGKNSTFPLPISTQVRSPGDALGALCTLSTLGTLNKVKWHPIAHFSLMRDFLKIFYLLFPCLQFLHNLFQISILKHFFVRGELSFFPD
jgi:hypothetical protein